MFFIICSSAHPAEAGLVLVRWALGVDLLRLGVLRVFAQDAVGVRQHLPGRPLGRPVTLFWWRCEDGVPFKTMLKGGSENWGSPKPGFNMVPNPIGSMYGIYANIWGILMANVTIYTIHGSYGNNTKMVWFKIRGHAHFRKPPLSASSTEWRWS